MPRSKIDRKIGGARRLYQIAAGEMEPHDARKESNLLNAARGFRCVSDWLFEVIEEQRREIERLERESAPLVKSQPKGVKAGCFDV